MIVEGTHSFAAPREVVWKLLLDPDVVAKTMPGATSMARAGEDRYEGTMRVGIGPITAGEFAVVITITEKVVPDHYRMQVDGRGSLGFTRGHASVALTSEGDSTVMHYQADMVVGGKMAVLGHRLLDSVSRSLLQQGLEAMSTELALRLRERPA